MIMREKRDIGTRLHRSSPFSHTMSCGCYCCRKPRYKRLVDTLYPEDPQDTTPVASNLDKLLYFASSSPEHLDRVGDYLAMRLRRGLTRERRG